MFGRLFVFGTKKVLSPRERARFFREVYGYSGSSFYRKYKYPKKGILGKIPFVKLSRGVVIIKEAHSYILRKSLEGKANYQERRVVLEEKDKEILYGGKR